MFATLLETNKSIPINDKTIVVLATRLDSFSIFSESSPGADSALTSLITLLSVVHTLSQPSVKEQLTNTSPQRNVLFAMFDGESFDYIGSSGALYDMHLGQFPVDSDGNSEMAQIRTKHFSHFIELNQLAIRGNASNHSLYVHKNVRSTQDTNNLLQMLQNNAIGMQEFSIRDTDDGQPLPPASLQNFIKDDNSLIGIVIANHQKEFVNKFYNSFLDTFEKLKIDDNRLIKTLTDTSTVISRTIFNLLTGSSQNKPNRTTETPIEANQSVMNDLFQCYLVNTSCALFNLVNQHKCTANALINDKSYLNNLHSFPFKLIQTKHLTR